MSAGRMRSGLGGFLLLATLIIAGIVVGGLIAAAAKNVSPLSWLAYAKTFGLSVNRPLVLDLSVLRLALGFELTINVAQALCVVGAVLLYRRIR